MDPHVVQIPPLTSRIKLKRSLADYVDERIKLRFENCRLILDRYIF